MNYERFHKLFSAYGLEYSEELHEKLEIYYSFLTEYNEKVNLTAITDRGGVWTKHFLDSILLLKHAHIPKESKFIDVGTGAGFPSVPIKLFRPDIKLTLLDSLNKRVVFLEQLCEKLGIEAETIHGRAEELAHDKQYREGFDIATARAVAALPVLSEYCLGFVKVGGRFISMKGAGEEFSPSEGAVKKLGGALEKQVDYELCGDKRRLFIINKISQTETKYPRNSGQIKKKTL